MDDLLTQAIAALKAGNKDEGRKLLIITLRQNPDNERAWGWMYSAAQNDRERTDCLKQMLRINPANQKAVELLAQLNGPVVPEKPIAKVEILPTAPVIMATSQTTTFQTILSKIIALLPVIVARVRKLPPAVIMVLALLMFCCCCLAFGSTLNTLGLVPSRTPTLKPTKAPASTITPTFVDTEVPTLLDTKTLAPIDTETPTPTIDAYMASVSTKFLVFQKSYKNLQNLHQEVTNDTNLLIDNAWKTKMGIALGLLQINAKDLASLSAPTKYQKFNNYLIQLSIATESMTKSYAKAIDNLDANEMTISISKLNEMTAIMQKATTELDNIASQTATIPTLIYPTQTPVRLATKTPTIIIYPTRTTAPIIYPTQTPVTNSGCLAAYPDFCIPKKGARLTCKELGRHNFTVLPPDPLDYDADDDGVGCEN